MRAKQIIKEDISMDARHMEVDHEVQMARSDCYKSAKYAVAIHKMLKDVSEMEGIDGWVAAKITKAADYLGSVKHYMEGQAMDDVELAVVPVAGDMTDAMTMPQESTEEEATEEESTEEKPVVKKKTTKKLTKAQKEKAKKEKMKEIIKDKLKKLADDVGKAQTLEAQQALQQIIAALINYVPGFNAYGQLAIPGIDFYNQDEIYKDKKVPENLRGLRNGLASELLHKKMVDMQYEGMD